MQIKRTTTIDIKQGADKMTFFQPGAFSGQFFQAPAGYPLDLVPNPQFALSLRKVRSAYTGYAIKVRRSSDNATQDIGFVGVDLDTASLLSFIGTNSGFIDTWYDQSANSFNVVQATAANQPRIVNAGVLEKDPVTGKVGIYFAGSSQRLSASATGLTQPFQAVVVATQDGTSAANRPMFGSQTGFTGFSADNSTDHYTLYAGTVLGGSSATSATTSNPHVFTADFNGASSNVYIDGTLKASGAGGAGNIGVLQVGAWNGSEFWKGWEQEFIAYSSINSTVNRQTLERNAGAYWGVAVA